MGKIDLRKMNTAAGELSEEAKRLRSIQVYLEELSSKRSAEKSRISEDMTLQSKSVSAEVGTAGENRWYCVLSEQDVETLTEMLNTEACALEKAADSLKRILNIYRKAENRVLAIYDGEYLVVPRTPFGISHFENLKIYEPLISIQADFSSCEDKDGGVGGNAEAGDSEKTEMRRLEGIL